MPQKRSSAKAAKPKVSRVSLPVQAELDYPYHTWESVGSKAYDHLSEKARAGRSRMNALEEHLRLKHFPEQKKKFDAEKKGKEAAISKQQAAQEAKNKRREERGQTAQYSRQV
jgi:hypothetical protein